jgi:hypothetical protein
LRVPVVDEEPDPVQPLVDGEVPGLLNDPRRVGVSGRSREWTRLVESSMKTTKRKKG